MFSISLPRDILQCSYTFLVSINVWKPFVVVGIFASSTSALLSQIIGGSRILLALARDELFGNTIWDKIQMVAYKLYRCQAPFLADSTKKVCVENWYFFSPLLLTTCAKQGVCFRPLVDGLNHGIYMQSDSMAGMGIRVRVTISGTKAGLPQTRAFI